VIYNRDEKSLRKQSMLLLLYYALNVPMLMIWNYL